MGKGKGKKKTKRKNFEERKRKLQVEDKPNPFESRVNKVKHKVLGQRLSKYEHGQPGLSKNKAFQKRKDTLLHEYKRKDKRGKGIVDNRVKGGEGGAERTKAKVWKLKQNMNPKNYEITLKDHDLENLKYNTDFSDLYNDEDMDLLRRQDYVESAHFGGGEHGQAKSVKEFMDEVMDEKRQRKLDTEETIEMTEQLDREWLNVKGLVRHKGQSNGTESLQADYDILVRELMFSDSGKAKLKPRLIKSDEADEPEVSKNPSHLLMDNMQEMMKHEDIEVCHDYLMKILNAELNVINPKLFVALKKVLLRTKTKTITFKKIYFLTFCATIREFKLLVIMKLVYFLKHVKLVTLSDVAKCVVVVKFLNTLTKGKFVPEIIQALQNLLVLCTRGTDYNSLFTPISKLRKLETTNVFEFKDLTCLSENIECLPLSVKLVFGEHFDSYHKTKMELSVFTSILELVKSTIEVYKSFPSFDEIFIDIRKLLLALQGRFPNEVNLQIETILSKFIVPQVKKSLRSEREIPVMITMLEPKIPMNHKPLDPKKKLLKKYKREFKGATRELRKDAAFLKDTRLKETLAKDRERKRKVNELLNDLSQQEHLYKKKK